MPTIIIETEIKAPPEVCFDLVRDISLHLKTASETKERAVKGVTNGKIGLGQTVTFEGVHFGFKQKLTVEVTGFDPPHLFVDEMTEGIFKSFKHVHEFTPNQLGTLMRDTLVWESPLGILGKMADKLFLVSYLKAFVMRRNSKLKELAENSR
jgi:ligand-binding SRPBCC domain-containing protein